MEKPEQHVEMIIEHQEDDEKVMMKYYQLEQQNQVRKVYFRTTKHTTPQQAKIQKWVLKSTSKDLEDEIAYRRATIRKLTALQRRLTKLQVAHLNQQGPKPAVAVNSQITCENPVSQSQTKKQQISQQTRS